MGRDGPCGFCGKKMLNCWIFIVGYLHNVERKDLPAASSSIAYETAQVVVREWYCSTSNKWFLEAMQKF
jgi:hypothetical protein